ncbi:MAG: DUF4406 domain-containing protein [Bacteroidetes bacterium]|nr:DUF4406 domain-containing protein [Bacteroidota bacterium]
MHKNSSKLKYRLEAAGYHVVNPVEIEMEDYFAVRPGQRIGETHQLRADLHEMLVCDGIAMMPITVPSSGCARELNLAFELEIPVKTVDKWIEHVEVMKQEGR